MTGFVAILSGHGMQSSWRYKVRLALGKTLAADLIDGSCKVSGKFQALLTLVSRSRARPKHPERCFPRNPAIWLHGLKKLSRMQLLNTLFNSIFRCQFVEKRARNIADLHPSYVLKRPTANASQGKVSWDSKRCRP